MEDSADNSNTAEIEADATSDLSPDQQAEDGGDLQIDDVPSPDGDSDAADLATMTYKIAIEAGDNQSATVNSAVSIPPSVKVTDENDQPQVGVTVTFNVVTGNGSVVGGSATTNDQGIATVTSWTLGTTAGANKLSASIGDQSVELTATGTPDKTQTISSNLSNNGGNATIGKATPIELTLLDIYGNPVAAKTQVELSVVSGDGALSAQSITTDANGKATFGVGGTTPGQFVVRATADGKTLDLTLNLVPGPAATLELTALTLIEVKTSTEVTVTLLDANGLKIPGKTTVELSVDNGGKLSATSLELTDGVGTITFTAGPTAGDATITAKLNGVPDATLSITGKPGAAAKIVAVVGQGQVLALDGAVTMAVRLTDADDNPLPNQKLKLALGAQITGSVAQEITTDSDGRATFALTVQSKLSVQPTYTTVTVKTLDDALSLDFVNTILDSTSGILSITAPTNGSNQTVNTSVAINVSVLDGNVNPVPGVPVTFTIVAGLGDFAGNQQTVVAANGQGIASAQLQLAKLVGQVQIVVSADGKASKTLTLNAVADVAASLSPSGVPLAVTVGTGGSQVLGVVLRDQYGNPISGEAIKFEVQSGKAAFDDGCNATKELNTSGNGYVGAALQAPESADVTMVKVTAVNFPTLTLTFSFTTSGPDALGRFTVDAASHMALLPGETIPIVATLTDFVGTPIVNRVVTFTKTSGDGAFVGPTTLLTDANGQVRALFTAPATHGGEALLGITTAGNDAGEFETLTVNVRAHQPLSVGTNGVVTLTLDGIDGVTRVPQQNMLLIDGMVAFKDGTERFDVYLFDGADGTLTNLTRMLDIDYDEIYVGDGILASDGKSLLLPYYSQSKPQLVHCDLTQARCRRLLTNRETIADNLTISADGSTGYFRTYKGNACGTAQSRYLSLELASFDSVPQLVTAIGSDDNSMTQIFVCGNAVWYFTHGGRDKLTRWDGATNTDVLDLNAGAIAGISYYRNGATCFALVQQNGVKRVELNDSGVPNGPESLDPLGFPLLSLKNLALLTFRFGGASHYTDLTTDTQFDVQPFTLNTSGSLTRGLVPTESYAFLSGSVVINGVYVLKLPAQNGDKLRRASLWNDFALGRFEFSADGTKMVFVQSPTSDSTFNQLFEVVLDEIPADEQGTPPHKKLGFKDDPAALTLSGQELLDLGLDPAGKWIGVLGDPQVDGDYKAYLIDWTTQATFPILQFSSIAELQQVHFTGTGGWLGVNVGDKVLTLFDLSKDVSAYDLSK